MGRRVGGGGFWAGAAACAPRGQWAGSLGHLQAGGCCSPQGKARNQGDGVGTGSRRPGFQSSLCHGLLMGPQNSQ